MIYHAADVPVWVAVLVAFFVILGAGLALVGAFGFLRLSTFYDRIHAPTLSTSWGTGGVMMASILFFTFASGRAVAHEILIGIFVTVTTPVTFMLLARAALHRDRMEKIPIVPRRKGEEIGLEGQDPSKG